MVDDLGGLMEANGATRMTGLTLGQLMLGPKPLQSQAELAEALHASVAAISGAVRQLVDWGLVERVAMRGSRSGYYRMAPHAWPRGLDRSSPVITRYREFAERALDVLPVDDPAREAVEEMCDYWAFMERETPALVKKFEEMRAAGKGAARP